MLNKLIFTYLRPYRRWIVLVLIFQLVASVSSLLLPSLNALIIDNGVAKNDTGYIWSHGAIMLAVAVIQVVFSVLAVWYGSRASMSLGKDVRHDLFHTVVGYSTREVNEFGPPSLITRITNDVTQVQTLVLMTCTLFVAAPITAVGGIVLAMREDVGLSAILAFAVPALGVAVTLVVIKLIPTFRQMQDRIDTINRVLREQITGMRVVRAFVREPAEVERFAQANDDLTDTSLRAGRLIAFMFPSIMLVMNLSTVATIWVGAARIDVGSLQVGQMIAFIGYLAQVLMSLMMASFMAMMVPRAAVCAERIMEVIETPSSVHSPAVANTSVPRAATLEFDHVGFHYPGADEPVLSDINLTVAPGTTTAIIGSTGAGKTTLLNLVPRLFDASSGAVRLGGVDVSDLALEDLWGRIGLVPQRPYLFSGTVASNLRHSKPDATDEELWDALEIAQAKSFVAAMPDGLDSVINQGGTNVSGGQRQRLAIARAIVRRPDLYLFDDSFSALDLATDAALRAALAPVTKQAAVLIVAQRVSTIRTADQIVVLERGRIVGVGTHDELRQTCDTYQEIVLSQLSAQEAA